MSHVAYHISLMTTASAGLLSEPKKKIISQLLEGLGRTFKGQNGVEFNFQSFYRHHISLSHQIAGVVGLLPRCLGLFKKITKILIWGSWPTVGGGWGGVVADVDKVLFCILRQFLGHFCLF